MEVGDGLLAVAAPDVRVDRPALDGPGTDERHLHHQVVELAGAEPGQGGHLGPGLHLEHPDGVGPAQHLVDLGLLGDGGQVHLVAPVVADEVHGVVQGGEHPQAQQVELDQADGRAVVLVPLQDAAVLHAGPLHRAHLDDGPVADDHAPGVDAQVARVVLHLLGQVQHGGRDVVGGAAAQGRRVPLGLGDLHPAPRVHLLAPRVLLAGGEPHGLGHVPHGGAGAVGDDVGHLRRVVAPVGAVDVLDGLLPPVGLDVEVDVGWSVALGRQEALEQQAEGHRIGLGDAERVADGAVGCAPPPLAVDVLLPAELHDVPHDQEVAGEAQGLDDAELVIDGPPGQRVPTVPGAGPVAAGGPLLHQLPQVAHLGVAVEGTGTAGATGP